MSENNPNEREYELTTQSGTTILGEYILREDWDSMSDPCPICGGGDFSHVQYRGGHYSQSQGTIVERNDYWYQQGGLYTSCKNCGEILFKSPAFDILKSFVAGEFSP
jgi:hypothetical protein